MCVKVRRLPNRPVGRTEAFAYHNYGISLFSHISDLRNDLDKVKPPILETEDEPWKFKCD